MKFIISLLSIITLFSCSSIQNDGDAQIKIVHWNIKELNSPKLKTENEQIDAVRKIFKKFDKNIISINELHFDKYGVPSFRYDTDGKNAELLTKKIGLNPNEVAISFHQANTGNKAKKKGNRYFTKSTKRTRRFADQDNFGLYPGQYSSAIISGHPIKSELVVKKLKWREFNPKINIGKFRRANGSRIPTSIELFDKSFSDVVIEIDGIEVHLISLHTVPSYHFGNKRTPNYQRNRDQLRFLEWYLTGSTDINIKLPKKYRHIKPLRPHDKFIAFGDWNSSIYDNNPGSNVLRRLFSKVKLWVDRPGPTHESQHYGQNRLKLTLDYIAYRGLKLRQGGIYYPEESKGRCFKRKDIPERLHHGLTSKSCKSRDNVTLKVASDHFPIWANFDLE